MERPYSKSRSPLARMSRENLLFVDDQEPMHTTSSQFYPMHNSGGLTGFSTNQSPANKTFKGLKRGAMDGPFGGKHLAEYLPSNRPPKPKKVQSSQMS